MPKPYNALKQRTGPGPTMRPGDGFVSAVFGGPIPVQSPVSGINLGAYDHQVASTALELSAKGAVVAAALHPALWATAPEAAAVGRAAVGRLLGPTPAELEQMRDELYAKGMHDHHIQPKFLGGDPKGPVTSQPGVAHVEYHREVARQFKKPGVLGWGLKKFPPVGGNGGSRDDWADFFKESPGRRDDANTILRNAARKIDRRRGTSFGEGLDRELKPSQGRGRPLAFPFGALGWDRDRND